MLTEELAQRIAETIQNVPQGSSKSDYQEALVQMFQSRGFVAGPFRPKAGGVADILVKKDEQDEGRILIELKPSGDWRHVAQAAVQLWSYAVELPFEIVKLAIFCGPRTNELHNTILDRLDIRYIFRSE